MRVGCCNIHPKRADLYIPTGLYSNHAGWDCYWFYLRNEGGLFPEYTGRVPSERGFNWSHGPSGVDRERLGPLLDAMRALRSIRVGTKEVSAAHVVAGFHRRRVLPLMERPLRLDQMGNNADPAAMARSQMSPELLDPEEIVKRVKAAVAASAFTAEEIALFPMRPEQDILGLVSDFEGCSLFSPVFFLPLIF